MKPNDFSAQEPTNLLDVSFYALMPASGIFGRNEDGYRMLSRLEVMLRELIVYLLEIEFGPQWAKSQVPGDVRESMKAGVAYEKGKPWMERHLHHPIYYADFPDLRKIICSANCWSKVFGSVFGNKEIFSAQLSGVEPIRNKVCHSRFLTENEFQKLRVFSIEVVNALEKSTASKHLSSFYGYKDAWDQIKQFVMYCRKASDSIVGFGVVQGNDMTAQWWFDEIVLSDMYHDVDLAASLIGEYAALPRGRGQGHNLEAWLNEGRVLERLTHALDRIEQHLGGM
jgi:hypothetical protein